MTRAPFLMVLYGDLRFDARAGRVWNLLRDLNGAVLVDSPKGERAEKQGGTRILRASRYLWFTVRVVTAALIRRPRVIYTHDFFGAFPGALAAMLSRASLVYDAHELIIPDPEADRRPAVLWLSAERFAVDRADLVVSANGKRGELMREYYDLDSPPLTIRNLSAVSGNAGPPVAEAAPAPQATGAGTSYVYQGSLNVRRGLLRFVDALWHLDPSSTLTLIGGGRDEARIREHVRAADLEGRVILRGMIPAENMIEALSGYDVGIVCYPERGLNNVYCASNKIYDYLHAGLPVVCTPQPPLREVVEEFGVGVVVERAPGIAEEMPEAVAMQEVSRRIDEFRANARSTAPLFTWEQESARLRAALTQLNAPKSLNRPGPPEHPRAR